MLKALGILCILAGSTGIGFLYAQELELRMAELQQIQQLLLLLRGEIRYMHQPLPEAFWHLSGSFCRFFDKDGKGATGAERADRGGDLEEKSKELSACSAY